MNVSQPRLSSMVCRASHFDSEWYARWSGLVPPDAYCYVPTGAYYRPWSPSFSARLKALLFPPQMNRKMWEWYAIAEVLHQRGMLMPGKRGIGFAVGKEPLPSLFAARGCSILATDLGAAASDDAWAKSDQQATSLEDLYWPKLIGEGDFRARVRFRAVDMRNLSDLRGESADFIWSACSFEHLGTIELGYRFVEEAMELLVPGGLAVHTTEFNVRSNTNTLESGPCVIYRRRDIEDLTTRLQSRGATLETPDFRSGKRLADVRPDQPPYYGPGSQHVKLMIGPYVATSMLVVIRK